MKANKILKMSHKTKAIKKPAVKDGVKQPDLETIKSIRDKRNKVLDLPVVTKRYES